MSEVGEFIVYCIELFKERQKITGREAYEKLSENAIPYIVKTYPAIHTMGDDLIYEDILTTI